ncbi:GTP cyclohydrolase-2 [Buchnera aphidicola (Pterocallis alni)]|uniref:GTP cyclohydrolase II n=1 Tax=Buchnera aphidicola TaxID=9 RepID=UPI003464364B
MKIKLIQQAKLPTPWGEFIIIGFEETLKEKNHIALIYGNLNHKKPILVRIHSECLTGDALFSLRCDCGFQLKNALMMIAEQGNGILIYHRQEGRNIGLLNKIKAYNLQDCGLDTVEANHKLGFSSDERDFMICANILKLMNVYTINLLTNNPLKITMLNKYGIKIIDRINMNIQQNDQNTKYLNTKKNKMGHLIHNIK